MKGYKLVVSTWIKKEIKRNKWNQTVLADKLNVSQSTVAKWLNGTQFPRPDKTKRIFNLLTDNIIHTDLFEKSTLGQKIFLLRIQEGLSIESLGTALVMSHSHIRKLERDILKPTDIQVKRLIDFFDVTARDLNISITDETFGERLKRERMDAGLTQLEVAEAIGQSTTMISFFENDKKVPSEKDLKEISNLLDVSIDNLIMEDKEFPFNQFAIIFIKQQRRAVQSV